MSHMREFFLICLCIFYIINVNGLLIKYQRKVSISNGQTVAFSRGLQYHSICPQLAASRILEAEKPKSIHHKFPVFSVFKSIASFLVLFAAKAASAAVGVKTKLKGWDLYGRVPYDDWLFTNDKLLDPNLFRKSIVEAVSLLILKAILLFFLFVSFFFLFNLLSI